MWGGEGPSPRQPHRLTHGPACSPAHVEAVLYGHVWTPCGPAPARTGPSSLRWAGDGSREHNGHWKPGRVSWLGPGAPTRGWAARGPPLTYRGSGNKGLCGSEQEDVPLLRPHVNCCSPAGVRPGVGGHVSTAAGCPHAPDRKHNAHWVAAPGSCLWGKDAAPVACDLPLGFPSTVAGVARSMLEPSIKWMLSADTRVGHGGLPLWPRALSLGPPPVPQTRG